MNTDNATLAARLYPDLPASTESLTVAPAANAQGSTATTTAPAQGAAPANAGAVSAASTPPANAAAGSVSPADPVAAVPTINQQVDELVGRELSLAERLHGAGQGFTDTTAAESAIGMKFEPLMADADDADRAALREGHKAAAAALVDFGVGASDANEIAGTLSRWDERVQADRLPDLDTLHQQRDSGLDTLRQEWGEDFDAKLELARRTCHEAEKRMPWLAGLIDAGAGNDLDLIRRMADLGLRQARKARRAKS